MVIDTYSRIARPAVHTIATESCPMILSTMPDGPKPVANSSGYATTRRGRSDDLAVTADPTGAALRRPSLRGRGRGPVCDPLHQDCVPLSKH
jgi:hypothetical protein